MLLHVAGTSKQGCVAMQGRVGGQRAVIKLRWKTCRRIGPQCRKVQLGKRGRQKDSSFFKGED